MWRIRNCKMLIPNRNICARSSFPKVKDHFAKVKTSVEVRGFGCLQENSNFWIEQATETYELSVSWTACINPSHKQLSLILAYMGVRPRILYVDIDLLAIVSYWEMGKKFSWRIYLLGSRPLLVEKHKHSKKCLDNKNWS